MNLCFIVLSSSSIFHALTNGLLQRWIRLSTGAETVTCGYALQISPLCHPFHNNAIECMDSTQVGMDTREASFAFGLSENSVFHWKHRCQDATGKTQSTCRRVAIDKTICDCVRKSIVLLVTVVPWHVIIHHGNSFWPSLGRSAAAASSFCTCQFFCSCQFFLSMCRALQRSSHCALQSTVWLYIFGDTLCAEHLATPSWYLFWHRWILAVTVHTRLLQNCIMNAIYYV